ncbi:fumarylacetoacetate hydrolase family protein [Streptomyces sp. NPDC001661]
MQLLSFRHAGRESWGILEGAKVIDLGARPAFEAPTLAIALRDDDLMGIAMNAVGLPPDHSLDNVEVLAPIPHPSRRVVRTGSDVHERRNARALAPPSAAPPTPQLRPGLAAVVGYTCERVAPDRATEMFAGYACFTDGTSPSFGPYLITPDDFRQTARGDLTAHVDTRLVLSHPVATLAHELSNLLVHTSQVSPLQPGDVLATTVPMVVQAKQEGSRCEVAMPNGGVLRRTLSLPPLV